MKYAVRPCLIEEARQQGFLYEVAHASAPAGDNVALCRTIDRASLIASALNQVS